MTVLSAAKPPASGAGRTSRDGQRLSNPQFAILLVMPAMALFVAIVLYPLIAAISTGFVRQSLVFPGREFVGFDNFATVLSGDFIPILTRTVVFTVGATAIPFVLGFAVALALTAGLRGSALLRGIFILPWVLPTVVTSFLWMWIFNANYGVLNGMLMESGILSSAQVWLGQPGTAMVAVIIAKTWGTFPWMMVMLIAGLQAVPKELHEAASIDGAGVIRRFRAITVPHLRTIIGIVLLLEVIWNFQHFETLYIMTGGGPAGATTTFSVAVYNTAFKGFDLGTAGALGGLWMLLLIVPMVWYIRATERRTT
jgi:multiple sugar transport system permease protein